MPTIEVDSDSPIVPEQCYAMVYATRQLSPGVLNPPDSEYRYLNFLPDELTFPADITTDYVARFGALKAGYRVGVRLVIINFTTGMQAAALQATCIVS